MSVDYHQICENYHNGMCVHVNHKIGIFQECEFEKLEEDLKITQMKKCRLKKTIGILEELVSQQDKV